MYKEKKLTIGDGDSYTGDWKNSKKHGFGIYTWGKKSEWFGAKYIGNFENDLQNGQGSFVLPSGDKYVGEFMDGRIDGKGVWFFIDGSRYIGRFKKGERDGRGVKIWSDGVKYVSDLDAYYHSSKNAYWPNEKKYIMKVCPVRSKNGKDTFVWEEDKEYEMSSTEDKK
jgi:hypothetical protein